MINRTEPTYCTPDDVAQTLDLPDSESDAYGMMTFSDVSHPSYDQVCKMILANEDLIDARTNTSWRENQRKDKVLSINGYWHDANAWRAEYYNQGGNFIQLKKNVLPWDPEKGDKLELRRRNNNWEDITDALYSTMDQREGETPGLNQPYFWFDYEFGKMYLRTKLFQQGVNSVRITYRFGSEDPVPMSIHRLACLLTASQVLNMQAFNIKVGAGGDISGIRDSMMRAWQDEMNQIWATYLRVGRVKSLYR